MRPPSRPAGKLHAATCAVPWRHALLRLSRAALLGAALVLQSCGGGAVEMNVVVFNYWPRALADVYVNGQHVGAGFGAYGPGGTGGSIWCCLKIKPGSVKVDWMLGGAEGDPLTGTTRSVTATLKEIRPGADYLGVYLYPEGRVVLDTARGIPDDKLP
jgi:hypothetical protein